MTLALYRRDHQRITGTLAAPKTAAATITGQYMMRGKPGAVPSTYHRPPLAAPAKVIETASRSQPGRSPLRHAEEAPTTKCIAAPPA
jgi:hypothetical protein